MPYGKLFEFYSIEIGVFSTHFIDFLTHYFLSI